MPSQPDQSVASRAASTRQQTERGRQLRQVWQTLREWAQALKRDVHAIYLAARDPRVPWYAKALAIAVASYALSPIDLIPDFIPVIGYLDDLIIVPLGVWLVVALIPIEVMAEYRAIASAAGERPVSKTAAVAIIAIWIIGAAATIWAGLAYWNAKISHAAIQATGDRNRPVPHYSLECRLEGYMPRAYWKGFLKLSLVTCPVEFFPASSQAEKTHFHQINKKTGNRLHQQMVDEKAGRAVDTEHEGPGYELSKAA